MPGVHALIIGVSEYPHLEGGTKQAANTYRMGQLSAAATGAFRLAEWLQSAGDRLVVPLESCRVLLAPSPGERALTGPATEETLPRFQRVAAELFEWRERCATDPDNIALFYFSGHGLERTRSNAVLLLNDFPFIGNPIVTALDVQDLFQGMAPSVKHPNMARTQLWFLDACRGYPSEFESFQTLKAAEVFGTTLPDSDNRCAPLYFGALPGKDAYSIKGETSIMGRALLECLKGAAGERQPGSKEWWVTAGSLLRGLQALVTDINEDVGGTQEVWDGGQMPRPNTPFVRVDSVPTVKVKMGLRPETAVRELSLSVKRMDDGESMSVPVPLHPNPFKDEWTAGVYRLTCTPSGRGIENEDWPVLPPVSIWSGSAT